MKVITSLATLMQLAGQLGQARKSGDQAAIAEAERKHNEYRDICLQSDEMAIGMTYGDLADVARGRIGPGRPKGS